MDTEAGTQGGHHVQIKHRDWGDSSTSQGMPKIASEPPERGLEQILPCSPQEEATQPTTQPTLILNFWSVRHISVVQDTQSVATLETNTKAHVTTVGAPASLHGSHSTLAFSHNTQAGWHLPLQPRPAALSQSCFSPHYLTPNILTAPSTPPKY